MANAADPSTGHDQPAGLTVSVGRRETHRFADYDQGRTIFWTCRSNSQTDASVTATDVPVPPNDGALAASRNALEPRLTPFLTIAYPYCCLYRHAIGGPFWPSMRGWRRCTAAAWTDTLDAGQAAPPGGRSLDRRDLKLEAKA